MGFGRHRIGPGVPTGALCAAFACSLAAAQPVAEPAVEEVVVTGTRIALPVDETRVQVTVLDRADIERGGADSLGKVLQALPANLGSPPNTNINNGGDGAVRIDLRGLGHCRTVVLLNGRRFPNGGSGGDCSPDVNMIPVSIIERVEVLASGASAVYGADAIGGVVNILTREGFEGAEAGAGYLITDESDGEVLNAHLLGGREFGRGHLLVSLDFTDQRAVLGAAREYTDNTYVLGADGTLLTTGSFATPQGLFEAPPDNRLGLAPGFYTVVDGTRGEAAADFRPFTFPADTYNFAPINYVQTPNRRTSLWVDGRFELTRGLELFANVLVHDRESEQLLASTPYFSIDAGASPMLASGGQGIPANNYYNPFGADVPFAARRFIETVGRRFTQDLDAVQVTAGLEGALGAAWGWEAAVSWSENETLTTTAGEFRLDRLPLAVGPSGPDASGRIVCGPPDPVTGIVAADAVIAGCVPLDLFSGAGSITQEMLGYLSQPLTDAGRNRHALAGALLRGAWGSLGTGTIRWALGAEFREEKTTFLPDPLKLAGAVGQAANFVLSEGGAFRARELYAESSIPLLRYVPAIEELELGLGARFSDFSSFGNETTWQAGLRWKPLGTLTVRANYGRVFRAPPNVDLYSEPSRQFDFFALDPCGNDPTPEQRVICAATGVPGGSYVQTNLTPFVVGGDPELQPENGDSFTAGLQWLPRAIEGLRVALERWEVDLDDAIGVLGIDQVFDGCFGAGSPGLCSRIRRNPNGTLAAVDLRTTNLGRERATGFDMDVGYRREGAIGALDVSLLATYLDEREFVLYPGAAPIELSGVLDSDTFSLSSAYPKWRGLASLDWSRGPFSAAYTVQHIGSMTECGDPGDPQFFSGCREVSPITYHDLQLGLALERGPRVTLAIDNLTDEDPPFATFTGLNTDPATYRMLGRSYFLRLVQTLL